LNCWTVESLKWLHNMKFNSTIQQFNDSTKKSIHNSPLTVHRLLFTVKKRIFFL
jgi:hypothetical protein